MEEKMYEKLFELVYRGLHSKDDEDEKELACDAVNAAIKYTIERVSWNWLSLEEKDANDGARTRMHNHMIDTFNIYFRYEAKKNGGEEFDFYSIDRKTVGDMGNRLIADLAMTQR